MLAALVVLRMCEQQRQWNNGRGGVNGGCVMEERKRERKCEQHYAGKASYRKLFFQMYFKSLQLFAFCLDCWCEDSEEKRWRPRGCNFAKWCVCLSSHDAPLWPCDQLYFVVALAQRRWYSPQGCVSPWQRRSYCILSHFCQAFG